MPAAIGQRVDPATRPASRSTGGPSARAGRRRSTSLLAQAGGRDQHGGRPPCRATVIDLVPAGRAPARRAHLPRRPPRPRLGGPAAADQRRRLGAAGAASPLRRRARVRRRRSPQPLTHRPGAARSSAASRWRRASATLVRAASRDDVGDRARLEAARRALARPLVWYRAVLRQGWRRQIRRMFAAVGAPVAAAGPRAHRHAAARRPRRPGEVRALTADRASRLDEPRRRRRPSRARHARGPGRVSIDGPGSSGKSTVGAARGRSSSATASATPGVLYRALAWLAVERGIDPEDVGRAGRAWSPSSSSSPTSTGRLRRVLVDGADVTDQLHAADVDRDRERGLAAAEVRAALLPVQRDLAAEGRHHHGRPRHRHRGAARRRPEALPRGLARRSAPAAAPRNAASSPDRRRPRSIEAELRRRDDASTAPAPRWRRCACPRAPSSAPTDIRLERTVGRVIVQPCSRAREHERGSMARTLWPPARSTLEARPRCLVPLALAGCSHREIAGRARDRSAHRRRQPHQQRRTRPSSAAGAGPRPAAALPGQGALFKGVGRVVPALAGRHPGQGRRQRHRGLPRRQGRCSTRARWWSSSPEGTRSATVCWASPSPAWRCWPRAGVPVLPVGHLGHRRLLGAGRMPRFGARSRCASAAVHPHAGPPSRPGAEAPGSTCQPAAHAPHRGAPRQPPSRPLGRLPGLTRTEALPGRSPTRCRAGHHQPGGA